MAQILYTPIGDMIHSITFLDPGTDRDQDGNLLPPTVFAEGVYAKIEGLWATGAAAKTGQQLITELSHRITIRYRDGLLTRMTIQFRGRTFTIERILDPDERQVELQLLCIERNDGR
jgi:SPP1 family predicted phage head-tail adaptor